MIKHIFCFLLLPTIIFAQSNPPGEIEIKATALNFERLMNISSPSSEQIDTLLVLGRNYKKVSPDTSLLIGEKGISLTEKKTKGSSYLSALLLTAVSHGVLGRLEKEQELLNEVMKIAIATDNEKFVAEANNSLGFAEVNKGNLQSGLHYFLASIKILEKLEDTHSVFRPYMNIAWIYFNMDEWKKAQEYQDKAAAIAEANDNDLQRGVVYGNRGSVRMMIGVSYSKKADSDSLNAVVFRDSAQYFYSRALEDLERRVVIAKELNDLNGEVSAMNNLVALKIQTGELEEALILTERTESLAKEMGSTHAIAQSHYNKAQAYRYMGQYQKSIEYGEESLQIAKANNLARKQSMANDVLYQSYIELGQFEKAFHNFESLQKYLMETMDAEKKAAVADVEGRFQNAKKQQQISELKLINEKAKTQRNLLLGGGLLLGGLLFFGFRMDRIRRERNDKIEFAEALIVGQEEERKRIARDLHDGVGQSLLLMKKQMTSTNIVNLENQKLITDTLDEIRSISRDLHPFQLEKFGLTATIKEMIAKVEKSTDLFITAEIENVDKFLTEKSEINFYRTIQEALNNVVKTCRSHCGKSDHSIRQ